MFRWLRKRKVRSWRFNKKFNKLSRINRPQLMTRSFKPWRRPFKPKWTIIKYYLTIKLLCSRKCILKLTSWSIETSRLSKTRRRSLPWSMKSISIFLRLNKKQPLLRSCKKFLNLGKLNTKNWKNRLRNLKSNVMNSSKSLDRRKRSSKP